MASAKLNGQMKVPSSDERVRCPLDLALAGQVRYRPWPMPHYFFHGDTTHHLIERDNLKSTKA